MMHMSHACFQKFVQGNLTYSMRALCAPPELERPARLTLTCCSSLGWESLVTRDGDTSITLTYT